MGAVPDSNWTTLNLIECDDMVILHNRWSGTYGGTVFRGIPTSPGNHFAVDHIHIYRMIDRRLAEHWVVRDDLGMLMQIGAITSGA
jgi:predicted ester cyclase